eukprot:jgi/Bigna1/88299/estExt_fgenesh1_pg.C_300105
MTATVTLTATQPFDDSKPKLTNFVWKEDREPHVDRRNAIQKAHPEVKKLFGVEPLTKYIVVGMVAVQYLTAIAMKSYVGTLPWFLVCYFIGSTMVHSIFLATHEIVHNLAFRSFTLSKLLAIFTQTPICVPYVIDFKAYHFEHHKLQGDEQYDTDLPTEWEGNFFQGKILKTIYLAAMLTNFFMYKTFGYEVPLFCFTAVMLASLHPCAGHFLAEHMVFRDDNETYSYYGPLNKITFNVGYHNEHHDFPAIPWSRLPLLRKIAPEFYNDIPCHDSWSAVMYNFVMNDNVTPFNRVKRHSKKK